MGYLKMCRSQPLVSIIMPTFNSASFIRHCINSVISQDYENWELIVVDNISNDNTIEIISSFADDRIRIIYNSNNGIIANARNKGIELARGEWLAFLDSDDLWDIHKLSSCLSCSSGFGLVYHRLQYFSTSDGNSFKTFGQVYARDVSQDPKRLLREYGPCLTTSGIMINRKVIEKTGIFDENDELVGGEDYDYWYRIALAGVDFKFCSSVYGGYQIHSNNFSSAKRSIKLIAYLKRKYFASIEETPTWIHASHIISLLKMKKRTQALVSFFNLVRFLNFQSCFSTFVEISKRVLHVKFSRLENKIIFNPGPILLEKFCGARVLNGR